MESIGKSQPSKLTFENAGYYAIGLIVLTLLGFWPSFFSKYIDGTANFNYYFHFHGAIATLWIFLLIVQPILIRKKKIQLHRTIGKFSYIILPLFLISVILLKHHTLGGIVTEDLGAGLWLQTKDIIIIGVMYVIALVNKHNTPVHARAMIATGIVFIEPTLGRFLIRSVFTEEYFLAAFMVTILIIYLLLITLIIRERKQQRGRWIFPLVLAFYILFHCLMIFQVSFPLWDTFAAWFVKLRLT
ncbi:hypothetical protein [Gynurincola endophyticus]|uniref:hypothetical protein n=1 Tax=Gynurincola endophyticus TaxID=2479004 RepID=UPI000F8E79EA|nr:hypothetical protein [Gynurincola endophyticus]